ERARDALSAQEARHVHATVAMLADHQHRAIFGNLAEARPELAHGNVHRAGRVAWDEFIDLAHIQEQRVVFIGSQSGVRLAYGDGRRATDIENSRIVPHLYLTISTSSTSPGDHGRRWRTLCSLYCSVAGVRRTEGAEETGLTTLALIDLCGTIGVIWPNGMRANERVD